ncbi:MAG TPA: hypothetical protein VLS89_05845, partial [Candidatus Nanopelagicales bacterium]|nr:hypothetical protein [Candidatus Nanopelagicales bacterium]
AAAAAPAAAKGAPAVLLELIWFDTGSMARIRRQAAWGPLLSPPPKKGAEATPEAAEQAMRADVAAVMLRGAATRLGDVGRLLADSAAEDGTLTPPLALLGGDLDLPFDEAEALQQAVNAVHPLAGGDKKLREVLDLITDIQKTPLMRSPEMAQGLLARLREAWSKGPRAIPPEQLDTQLARALLEQRAYQKRELLNETWIRGVLSDGDREGRGGIPVYLSWALSRRLPLFVRMRVRLIAEVLLQQDQREPHPLALRVVALARVAPREGITL